MSNGSYVIPLGEMHAKPLLSRKEKKMDLKELTKEILLKRYREQLLFGRFDGVDIKAEVLNRMDAAQNLEKIAALQSEIFMLRRK